jgi:acyl-CoA synthetase (AMP-forming)/AMP-acid ligase II
VTATVADVAGTSPSAGPIQPGGNVADDLLRVGWWADFHARSAARRQRPALIDADGAVTWTELAARVRAVAGGLHRAGVRRGDVVMTVLHNCREGLELTLACARIGAVTAPVSYRYVVRELAFVIGHARPRLLVVEDELSGLVAESVEASGHRVDTVFRGRGGPQGYDALTADLQPDDHEYTAPDPGDPLWLAFTGGATGLPKACLARHRDLVLNFFIASHEFPISAGDVQLLAAPYYHSQPFMYAMHQLMVGGTLVILPKFSAAAARAAILEFDVTVLVMAPTLYEILLHDAPGQLPSLRTLVTAGAPLRSATLERLEASWPHARMYEYYGSTEIGYASVLPPEDRQRKRRSVGRPFFGMTVAVLDPDGNEVPTGEVGEICKRGLMIAPEYAGNPEATRELFRPGGWATAGDLGYVDDEGYLYLVDRKKDVIISGGANVYATEVEDVIATHPQVREVAVVGVPDERWGEIVKAFVVPLPGCALDAAEVHRYCQEQLAGYKRPRLVAFLDELPKNPVGKVIKAELVTEHWSTSP